MGPSDPHADNASSGFPATRHSIVSSLRGESAEERRRAFDVLVQAYWKPIYKYIRVRFKRDAESAEDLTQGFLTGVFEKGVLDGFDAERGRLRTFLRTCIDRFVARERTAAGRQKRGGDRVMVSLDFDAADRELGRQAAGTTHPIEDYFEQEWARSVFALAVERLRRSCESAGRQVRFVLFERYDLRDDAGPSVSYADLARETNLSVSGVTNHLSAVRREFRRLVLETVRELTASEQEYRDEVRALLGVDPPP